jgi:hypothetical protein
MTLSTYNPTSSKMKMIMNSMLRIKLMETTKTTLAMKARVKQARGLTHAKRKIAGKLSQTRALTGNTK